MNALLFLACADLDTSLDELPPDLPDLVVHAALSPGGPPRYVTVREGRVSSIEALLATEVPADRLLQADWVSAGLIDAHAHPGGLGSSLAQLDLRGTSSLAEVQAKVAEAAESGEGWLTGRGWDQNDWSDHEGWPLAAHLDHVDRPVALRRVDGHATWLNSAGLREAGIMAGTPDVEGGVILRDHDSLRPLGILVDSAVGLLELPEPGATERERRLRRALDEIAAAGLVGVHDMGVSDATLEIYERLDRAGELPIRIWAYLDPEAAAVQRLEATGPWGGNKLQVVGVKMYADGALGSRGALLREDYADQQGHRGVVIQDTEELAAAASRLLAVDAQLAVHAIGDAGIGHVLDAFALAREQHPQIARPLRVEHLQVVHPQDLARMPGLNAVASMQPTHCTSDMPWAGERLGPARLPWSYAWRDVLDAGVVLAFGSDFPVELVSPSYGLWSGTRRADLEGQPEGGWRPDQLLTLEETVAAFSSGTYAALGQQGGVLEVGAAADLSLWSSRDQAGGTWHEALATVVEGRVVWRR